jgi:predicted PurR-regulated permease PerM
MDGPPGQFYARVFWLVVAGLLALALLRILQPFAGAILWAVLLAVLLAPANAAARRVLRGRRAPAAIAVTLGVMVGIIGPAALLGVVFAKQAAQLVPRIQALADRYQIARPGDLLQVPLIERWLLALEDLAPVSREELSAWLVTAARHSAEVLVAMSGPLVVGALGTAVMVVLTVFLLFFLLRDGEDMMASLRQVVPMDPQHQDQLFDHLTSVTRAVVFGALVTALIQGALVGVAFAIVGLPSPVVFGALAAGAALIPFAGTALVWAPGAIALAVQGRWWAALFVAAWGVLVVSTADNVVRPIFISGRAQISTLPVFLGLAGGLAAFGPIGFVLGPVIVALALALFPLLREARAGGPVG